MVLSFSCIHHRPQSCQRQSDCAGEICSSRGFCTHECKKDVDCPCGSICATSCGICIRADQAGPATCFAFQAGLDTPTLLGACRDVDAALDDGGVEDGRCNAQLIVSAMCLDSPPLDAGLDANGELDADGSVETGSETEISEDAGDEK